MDTDYYSIDSILAENQVNQYLELLLPTNMHLLQKLQCTYQIDVPNLGYIDGGSEKDVRSGWHLSVKMLISLSDQDHVEDAAPILASPNFTLPVESLPPAR